MPSTQHLIVENSERTRSKLQKLSKSKNGFKGFTTSSAVAAGNNGKKGHPSSIHQPPIGMTSQLHNDVSNGSDSDVTNRHSDVIINGNTQWVTLELTFSLTDNCTTFGCTARLMYISWEVDQE